MRIRTVGKFTQLLLQYPHPPKNKHDYAITPGQPTADVPTPKAQSPQSPAEWAQASLNFHPDPKQAEVLNSNNKKIILCCTRQWGKSTVIALKALHKALHQPGTRIMVLSRGEDQAGMLIEIIKRFAAELELKPTRVRGKQFSLAFNNSSKIWAIAHAAHTGRGNTADVVIIDEAALVQDAILGAILPALAATNGDIWLLSTPNGETGFFYETWHHGESNGWHKVKATADDCPRITKEFLAYMKQSFPDTFQQEFFCQFQAPPGRLLTRERIEAMLDPSLNSNSY